MLRSSALVVAQVPANERPLSAQAMLTRLLSVLDAEGVIERCTAPDAVSIDQQQCAHIWIDGQELAAVLFFIGSKDGRQLWNLGLALPADLPPGVGQAPPLPDDEKSHAIVEAVAEHLETPFVGEVSSRWFAQSEMKQDELLRVLRGELHLAELKFGAARP